ncbi:MAG: hypothetical protein HDT42_03200 [Ruminococcaceae bacterium]|nr:hypothetical protein [Oscillospiraceae bacterium]
MLKKLMAFTGKIGKKGKAMLFTAIMAVSTCAMTVAASAAEVAPLADTAASNTENFLQETMDTVGPTISAQFTAFVSSLIPVLVTVMMAGLGIYAVVALIKYAKKILGSVAG